jgi:hypothetical protein
LDRIKELVQKAHTAAVLAPKKSESQSNYEAQMKKAYEDINKISKLSLPLLTEEDTKLHK